MRETNLLILLATASLFSCFVPLNMQQLAGCNIICVCIFSLTKSTAFPKCHCRTAKPRERSDSSLPFVFFF